MSGPGIFRVADGSAVTQADAVLSWADVARPVLIEVARSYHATISYKDLAEAVEASTGIRTRLLLQNWIGRVLGTVSSDCHRRNEPLLSALCVHADGSVGAGYAQAVRDAYGGDLPADLERHAATSGSGATCASAHKFQPTVADPP
jgi:hypothetical protein